MNVDLCEFLLIPDTLVMVRSPTPIIDALSKATGLKCSFKSKYGLNLVSIEHTLYWKTTLEPVEAFKELLRLKMFEDPFKLEHKVQMDMLKSEFIYAEFDEEGLLCDIYEIDEVYPSVELCAHLIASTVKEAEELSSYISKLLGKNLKSEK